MGTIKLIDSEIFVRPQSRPTMALELDHVFICCSPDAPEADALVRFGLLEGSSNMHPGQGTANRRFFFRNAYLELLWVSNPAEARSEQTRHTRLWERWSSRASGACPFGVIFRPTGAQPAAPFETWSYINPTTCHLACPSSSPLAHPSKSQSSCTSRSSRGRAHPSRSPSSTSFRFKQSSVQPSGYPRPQACLTRRGQHSLLAC